MTHASTSRRSWKNLLINKRYQLRFTLFMVGVAAALMTGLGWWVIQVADDATMVAKSRIRGTLCPPILDRPAPSAAPAEGRPLPETGDSGSRRPVALDESSLTLTEEPSEPSRALDRQRMRLAHDHCEAGIAHKLAEVEQQRHTIVIVLLVSGVVLILGLIGFGIKMTHKVAGPIHKVTLYLNQLRDGHYAPVYDLRKGDELVAFYDHFKRAHSSVIAMERADIERIKAALAAAIADGVVTRSIDAGAAASALRDVLDRKESSFV